MKSFTGLVSGKNTFSPFKNVVDWPWLAVKSPPCHLLTLPQ